MTAKGLARRWTPALFVVLASFSIALSAASKDPATGSGQASTPGAAQGPAAITTPTPADVVRLEAQQQRREGPVVYADGDVDIHYGDMRLRADHVEYNTITYQAAANGHVQFDHGDEHLNAERLNYNVRSGTGRFEHASGSVHIEREPNPSVLITPNPLTFVAESVDRVDASTYRVYHARLTVCDPRRPNWTFDAVEATLHVGEKMVLIKADFRLFRVPLIYMPYATVPAGRRARQSGFLMPEVGHSSTKGYVVGDSYYWAPTDWADATAGAQLLTQRGWEQTGDIRLWPWQNVRVSGNYFGVVDRLGQGGHRVNVKFDAQMANGWHAALDFNELTSLTFQEVFSPTFSEAVNSEVHTTAFLTRNFAGFSLNFAANNYKDYLTPETTTTQSIEEPGTAIVLRTTPEARFGSMDRAPWERLPFYFGFEVFGDGVHRNDPGATNAEGVTTFAPTNTPTLVDRSEFAPRATLPLHWGAWLGITPTYTFRSTLYGDQEINGRVVSAAMWRNTGELSVDLRPPALARVWTRRAAKWKHTIEPDVAYNYVTGVNDFARFVRIDQDDTITDTNEIEYSVTQRLFRRKAQGAAQEFASWTLLQKYYFDPTFGGAIVPGQRNVFQALDSVTPFAFADSARRFSPLVSDIKISPGGPYDAEFRMDYDPVRARITTAESLLKMHPYSKLEFTVAQYSIDANPVLQPLSSQIRALVGYGDLTKRGWSGTMGFSYDLRQDLAQNELAQVSYNSSCCGLAVGYQRLALGNIRRENQFRIALIIANIGTFGNLRRQEKIF